jgi:hypothetical protein
MLYVDTDFTSASTVDTIDSSSESSFDTPSPSLTTSSEPPKQVRYQSLYDAVADRSKADRFRDPSKVDPRTGKHPYTRAAAPESVLAGRWRKQTKRTGKEVEEEEEDVGVKMARAGLLVPSHRDEALPDSVLPWENS